MEIERKFTVKELPANLEEYPHHSIEQAYLCTDPVIRVRKEDNEYYLTYKGNGLLSRQEFNLALTKESYYHLRQKADGNVISKKRYLIPLLNPKFEEGCATPPADYSLTIELDIFDEPYSPLTLAEVEFGSESAAQAFIPPDWFFEDVTYDSEYHNSNLSKLKL